LERILITGANGLLGQKIVALLADNPEVELLATSKSDSRIALPNNASFQYMDVCNAGQVEQVIAEWKPTAIVHTAAMTNVDACETERDACYALNVTATRNVAASANKVGAYMVHISTDFIFDGAAGPYSEEDFPNPLGYYGATKWESEEALSTSGAAYSILRTMILFGVEANAKNNLVSWAKSALEKGDPINVIDDQFRAPTLAENLAEACINAIGKRAIGVYHVSGSTILSIRDMVSEIAKFWKLDQSNVTTIKTADLGQPAKRPPYTGFVLDRAIKELDFHPLSFLESLQVMDEQLKANSGDK
jgi:dTDP-4-dehydrorhamnose reductase